MKLNYCEIIGFDGRYSISNKGKVYDLIKNKFVKNRIITTKRGTKVIICDLILQRKKKTSIQVHSTVAKYFVKNPNNYMNVWHKDKNPLNNNAWNLIYIDSKLTRQLTCKNQYKGGRKKLNTEIQNTINFLQNLDKKGIDEQNIVSYYETKNISYIWEIYTNNINRLCRFDTETVHNAFEYYIDRVKRGIVCNYQFKILLECIHYEQKKNTLETVKLLYFSELLT